MTETLSVDELHAVLWALPRKRERPEEALHIQVVKFLNACLAGSSHFWHTPNGGKRGLNEAKRFKAMAVRAGMPRQPSCASTRF